MKKSRFFSNALAIMLALVFSVSVSGCGEKKFSAPNKEEAEKAQTTFTENELKNIFRSWLIEKGVIVVANNRTQIMKMKCPSVDIVKVGYLTSMSDFQGNTVPMLPVEVRVKGRCFYSIDGQKNTDNSILLAFFHRDPVGRAYARDLAGNFFFQKE